MFEQKRQYASGIDFFSTELENYFVDYIPGELNQLVFTFENADQPKRPRLDATREPWGGTFLHRKGYSVIGVKPKRVDWYRGADLHRFFRSHTLATFVSSFRRVTLYGSSMGGYAALAFAEAVPGATVIAFNPQSTLHPELVPWESRYAEGRAQDWSGDFADARRGAARAGKVCVAYDPLFEPDRKHVDRLDGAELVRFKMPLVGHIVAGWMQLAGVLPAFLDGALAGTLTEEECRCLARRRRVLPRWYVSMGMRTRSPGVALACARRLAGFEPPEQQRNEIRELMRTHRLWHGLEDARIRAALGELDEPSLVGLLKPASDDGFAAAAWAMCEAAIERGGAGWRLLVLGAECLHRLSRLDEALVLGRQAVAQAPTVGNCFRILARILHDAGATFEACEVGRRGVGVEPDSVLGWLDLARYHEALEQWDAIRDCTERAAALRPDDAWIRARAAAVAERTMSPVVR